MMSNLKQVKEEQTKKVLMLVEQDGIKKSIKRGLSSLFKVIVRINPEDALSYLDMKIPDIIVTDLYFLKKNRSGIELGIEFIRDLKTKLEAKKAKTVIVILSKYSQKFNLSKEEELKKNGMQFPTPTPFGPGKKYDWSQLENFQKQLKELGITRNQFFDKFDYIKSFEKLATELFEIFKRSEKVDEQMD